MVSGVLKIRTRLEIESQRGSLPTLPQTDPHLAQYTANAPECSSLRWRLIPLRSPTCAKAVF